jgi:transcriptional regulator with XRE-family HTH domain
MASCPGDPVMDAIRRRFEQSGMSLEALGVKMGYPKDTARKSAWQFINRTNDPRLSMIRRFANATGVRLSELMEQEVPVQ